MATNLNEFYKEKGQALPSVDARAGDAAKAGITGYVGSAAQNATLLGYLQNTPNKGNNNVITSESLTTETPVETKPPVTGLSEPVTTATNALVNTTKLTMEQQEAQLAKQQEELAAKIKASGDTGAFEEQVYKDQGVDQLKTAKNKALSLIEQEQLSTIEKLDRTRREYRGTTAGAGSELERIQRDSATNIAKYGIGLAAISRDYESAANIAMRQIEANNNKVRADLESSMFVFEQLGTKLATEKANAFALQLRALDREEKYYDTAIQTAIDGAADGTIDQTAAFSAIQKLTSGEISIDQFYTELGVTDNNFGNVNGYDITSWAKDPAYTAKVTSIYDTMSEITDAADADAAIKSLSPDSPITGEMVMSAAQQYNVDPRLMLSMLQVESTMGVSNVTKLNNNPSGITWSSTLEANNPGITKGSPRPSGEGGNYAKFATLQDGVNFQAKWLNNNRSKGVYRGEFASTISTIVDASGASEANKNRDEKAIKTAIANGDWRSAYAKLENGVSKILTGTVKTDFDARRTALPSIDALAKSIDAYEAAGGNMGILKGSAEQIENKLGAVADPAFKTLATDLRISFQKYRSDISGAAFSAEESADYEDVTPGANKSFDLNKSILEGMRDNFQRQVDSTVDAIANDEGIQFIREYARTGEGPNQRAPNPTFSTPNGNSFTIVSGDEISYGGRQQTTTDVADDTPDSPPLSVYAPKPMDWSSIMAALS